MRAYRRLFATGLLICLSAAAQDIAAGDAKSRIKAAKALSKSGSTAIPQLSTLLKDTDTEVRQEAVRSIVAIGTQHSIDPLIEATRDNDPEVQLRAIDGIVNYYVPGYVGTGLQRLTSAVKSRFDRENTQIVDPSTRVREDAVKALGNLVRGGGGMEVRASAARAVGILRGKDAMPELLEGIRMKDDNVIFESLIAIQKIRDTSVAPRITFLLRDLKERVQVAAIETTGILRNKDAVPDLQKVYKTSESDKVRQSALGALGMLADPTSRSLFGLALEDKSEGVRASGAEGLGRLREPEGRPKVEKAFNDEKKMGARLAAAFALVSLGNYNTAELSPLTYLVNTLNSRSYRNVAEPYLVELTRDHPIKPALYGFLRQGTPDEKMAIARILGLSGDNTSVAPLEALTKDSDINVQSEAIRALKNLRARLG